MPGEGSLFYLLIGSQERVYIPPGAPALDLRDASGNCVWKLGTVSGGETVFNDDARDVNFRVEADANTNALIVDAGAHGGVGAVGIGAAVAASPVGYLTIDPAAFTATAATSFGRVNIENAAAVTIPTGTTGIVASLFVGEPNITATGTVTRTATVYIEAAATEGGTENFALWVDAGGTRLDGDLSTGGTFVSGAHLTVNGGATSRAFVTAVGNQIHLPAVSYTDSGVNGTIAVLAAVNIAAETVLATNTITYTDAASLRVADPVASTGATFTRKYGIWSLGQIRTDTNVQVNNTAAFASTQPVGATVYNSSGGTAPAGAIVTGGAVFTDGTTMKKIIANGTVSNIET